MKNKIRWIAIIAVLVFSINSYALGAETSLLLKNGNIITVAGETIKGGDILIEGTRIVKVGTGLRGNAETEVVDLAGKWVMPGIIDSHSHIAIEGGVNEMGNLITSEVDVKDVIWPEDMNIFYALAGGVTTVHTMHGSANSIGGRGIVLKLRWGKSGEEMIFKEAPPTIKWALGENPKGSNFSGPGPARYPRSRMGVEASIRLEFEKAKDYMRSWEEYEKSLESARKMKKPAPLPPKKNIRLEVISDILKGHYWIRCHAYQSEEMHSIMKLCDEYKVKLVCFEHGLEGYRITNELVKYGVAVSGFADFWAYKWEAYNTMPHAAALTAKRGVLTAINSDDAERMRRLFHDAAKTVRYGGLSEIEAIKTITINPAIILGIDKWTGTIEEGKDADLAVFNRHPFDPYTICEMTLVDGDILFDRAKYLEERRKAEEEKKKQEEQKKEKEKKSGGEVWP
ncbi:MAG: amidohydrolase family protein [Candidatus Aminicenantes bacterium]|nr:amidohydrolase family protein [Candidatus Aminicenantes bacterium]